MKNKNLLHSSKFLFGIAPAIMALLLLPNPCTAQIRTTNSLGHNKTVTDSHGAIIRGDTTLKQIALVFTGDEYNDGGEIICVTLKKHSITAAFFLTGNFYSSAENKKLLIKLKDDGHYLGPHSDKHLLYADWIQRDSLLVSEKEFSKDLQNNFKRMAAYGIKKRMVPYFLPPYEWYNSTIAKWTEKQGLRLINFTPGTRSNADYTYPAMNEKYRSSDEIYRSILHYESADPHGLNGFILLLHIGTHPGRIDKFYNKLDKLLTELQHKNYSFVRIDELLK